VGTGPIESPVTIITAASLVVALAVTIFALHYWRQRNMKYFAFLSLAVSINVLGYYLEVSATTLEAAIVACKVAYLGVPLSGLLLFLFSLDYSDRIRPNRVLLVICGLMAPVFTLSVFLYPWVPLFYQDLSFSAEGLVPHLVVTPGLLYYPCFIYAGIFSILASVNLLVSFVGQKRYEGAIIFIVAICVPLMAQIYPMIFGLIDGWNPQRTALTLSIALLAVYLAFYKQARWESVAREMVVQDMDDAFILLDDRGVVIDHNLSAERYFPQLKQSKQHRLEDIWEFPTEQYQKDAVYQYDMQLGERVVNLKVTTSPLEAGSEVTGTLVVINDDTAGTQMMKELSRRARIDELTGLNNRATFFRDASLSFDLAKRLETNRGCALMLDIDLFKGINDTYGHATGDEVLTFMGQLLLRRFRHTDICGRYGGEELSVWMPATTLDAATRVAEELRGLVAAKVFEQDTVCFSVTVSIGVASMGSVDEGTFEDLMKKADFALYEAKSTGRNRVCVYN
jgi:diguanylate cyclase (GGDEF)-like protein